MTWAPITREALQARIDFGLDSGDECARAFFHEIAREPVKWKLHPWGDAGGGFWVVAVLDQRVVWFNDIEDGFNISTFKEEGVIRRDEYWCNQDELHGVIVALTAGGGQELGPPRPSDD